MAQSLLDSYSENVEFEPPTGKWSERLLQSMYMVTARHGAVYPHQIERLWSTVAGNKRNIIPILDYVVSTGQQKAVQVGLLVLRLP